jgi:biofilm PGA synthesis lipoprotein PgaB
MCGEDIVLLEKIFKILVVVVSILFLPFLCGAADEFLVLCYHDILKKATLPEDVPRHVFVKQLEYLKTHGYHLISPEDILAARREGKSLPEKSVLLTFDDAYRSFYEFVYPVLSLYDYPAVLSIVSSWIGQQPDYIGKKELMSWEQIEEVADSGRVYLASHTHTMHKGIVSNSAGNEEAATSAFIYYPEEKRYESEENFGKRIAEDLTRSIEMLETHTGKRPHMITWPYGQFNKLGMEKAEKLGFEMMFILTPGFAHLNSITMINRNIITKEMELEGFVSKMKNSFQYFKKHKIRVAQIDLDMIINPLSYEESDHNLGLLIERLVALGVNTVFIQGFCDSDGSGNIRSLYFHNETLTVEMDFLSHVTNRIRIRGIEVYVWMPVLSYELSNTTLNNSLKVREYKDDTIAITTSWYRRLSPFHEKSLEMVKSIYRDLSAHVRFDGIMFQDDAYLSDNEDYHSSALQEFKKQYGIDLEPSMLEDDAIRSKWVAMKTEKIDWFTRELKKVVQQYRPTAKFARNIYSEVVLNPSAQEWFSQNFEEYLKQYDYTVIMAYPQMEGMHSIRSAIKWYGSLICKVDEYNAQKKVIFKIQSYDWAMKTWIDEDIMVRELTYLLSSGAKHVGYYPDNVYENKPNIDEIVSIISSREYPRTWKDESLMEGN